MYRHWHPGVALAALAIIACSDTTSPGVVAQPSEPNLSQYPLDSELAHVKDQGFIVPTLRVTIDDHEARAEASLAYFGNFVRMSLTLDVLRGYETVVSRSTVPQEVSGFFPTPGWLQDGIVIPVYQACGLAAQAQSRNPRPAERKFCHHNPVVLPSRAGRTRRTTVVPATPAAGRRRRQSI
jgi:hypothetical protein